MSVRALIVDPSAPAAVRLAEVADPIAGPGQLLIEVHHISLNHGDINDARADRLIRGDNNIYPGLVEPLIDGLAS